jgi:predicted regulator of Ras-like GTPase activity (Roadblock/LC7/MglB family)
MLRAMDADEALAHLTDVSPQVEQVALVDSTGTVAASTFADATRAESFVSSARALVEAADGLRGERALDDVAQLEAATVEGSVFVVRDGGKLIVATTRPDPTVGLVFYDLKHALRSLDDAPEDERGAA